ncbi:MAG: hypothetical protein AAFQ52_15525 [Chloroflexota bacterium]
MRASLLIILSALLFACIPGPTPTPLLPTVAPEAGSVAPLIFWETQTSSLSSGNNFDLWLFEGNAGDNIFIRSVTRGVDIRLSLLQDSEVLVESTDRIELSLPVSGSYRVRVDYVAGVGEYDIGLGYTDRDNPNDTGATAIPQVVGVPTPTAPVSAPGSFIRALDENAEISDTLTDTARQHIYTLSGTQGSVINLELYQVSGELDPVLRLFDAEGNLLAMDDNSLGGQNARLLNVRLPETATYSIQVDGKERTGDYRLVYTDTAITLAPDPQPSAAPTSVTPYVTPQIRFAIPDERLQNHRPAINSLVREGDFQRFSFFANAGERVSIVVEPMPGSNILPSFEVFDTDGAQVGFSRSTTSNADGAAVAPGVIIAQTGAHLIIVTGEDNTTGQFLISFGRGATVRDEWQGTGASNTLLTGAINSVGSRHVWELPLNPGDVINVAVGADTGSFDPVIELATADGIVLYQDDDGGDGESAVLRNISILEPATYLVRIYDEAGRNTGGYSLLWNYVNLASTPTPIPSQLTILSVDDTVIENNYAFYAFQGQAGQRVRIGF